MPITYTNAIKTTRITATRDHFAAGTLEIQDASDNPLATFDLTASGGSIATDTWTVEFAADTVEAATSGTAAKAVIKTSGGSADLVGLTVGESGADVTIDNTDINAGQDVTMTAASIQHAA